MSDSRQFICVGCPIGCPMQLDHEGRKIIEVSGNECDRGAKYAHQEFTDPRRELATTVAISGACWARLPVKSSAPVPKDRILEAARIIHTLQMEAPISLGQVLLTDLLGQQGLNVIATRTMERAR